ncbi:MAG: hypothetical protein IT577_13620 [Verrucomicrobiae bacterium]|nr:hypothetical protein [Verrucomicrobiae bacterium]
MTPSARIIFAAACLTLCGVGPATATYIYIDTFSSPTQSLSTGVGGAATNVFDYTNSTVAVGNERELLLVRTNETTGVPMTSIVASSLSNGITYATPANGLGYVRAIYDGVDASSNLNFSGLASLDLTDGGNNDRFQIRGGADVSNGFFIVTVYSSASDYSQQVLPVPANTFLESAFTNFYFTFTGMTDFGNGANFEDVNAIVLELNGLSQPGIDFRLNLFVAIPEPSGWWPAAGLAAVVLLRRRLTRK